MKFKKIFVEESLRENITAKEILKKLSKANKNNVYYLDKYEDVFSQVKKPYLEKRDNLNLFIAEKKGTLVKEAPDAYGIGKEKHFYFINSYNCIYECEYCYLQGFFNSPDLVLFVNWEDIAKEIKEASDKNPGAWFHAGEFSDSLALSHLTDEIPKYFDLFTELSESKLELRTKSVNIKKILEQKPLKNIITSFSLSTEDAIKKIDLKTPPLQHRLKAIEALQLAGHPVGLHLDPITWAPNWREKHEELIDQIKERVDLHKIEYISVGVVRFTEDVFYQFKNNYPNSDILRGELTKSFDQKIRYPKALRSKMLHEVEMLLTDAGALSQKIYKCME